jgi:hypothetical protein
MAGGGGNPPVQVLFDAGTVRRSSSARVRWVAIGGANRNGVHGRERTDKCPQVLPSDKYDDRARLLDGYGESDYNEHEGVFDVKEEREGSVFDDVLM